jgi:integrase
MILRMEARFWASSVRVQIMAKKKVPGLLHHKGKNLGYSISPATRKATYHGQWGLVATKQAYLRWCADLLTEDVSPSIVPEHEPVVADLVNAMIKHSISYYRDPTTGKPTSQLGVIKSALRELDLYLEMKIKDFKPSVLVAVRAAIVNRDIIPQSEGAPKKKLCISSVNNAIVKIRQMFKLGVGWELVPVEIYQALACVQHLNWRTAPTLRNPDKIAPVPVEYFRLIMPHLKPMYRAVLTVHLATGMRVKELCSMRWSEMTEVEPGLWCYAPAEHKNSHRGDPRLIYMKTDLIDLMRSVRKPLWDKDAVWCQRGVGKSAGYSGMISGDGYARAIEGAQKRYNEGRLAINQGARTDKKKLDTTSAKRAPMEHWTPLQIRHTVATQVRRTHGLEGAQAVLGHSTLDATQIYAEKRDDLARCVARG